MTEEIKPSFKLGDRVPYTLTHEGEWLPLMDQYVTHHDPNQYDDKDLVVCGCVGCDTVRRVATHLFTVDMIVDVRKEAVKEHVGDSRTALLDAITRAATKAAEKQGFKVATADIGVRFKAPESDADKRCPFCGTVHSDEDSDAPETPERRALSDEIAALIDETIKTTLPRLLSAAERSGMDVQAVLATMPPDLLARVKAVYPFGIPKPKDNDKDADK